MDVPAPACPPELFAETSRALARAGFRGANVTIPHKKAALAVADVATATAHAIGAANTLTYEPDGTIHADNTDAPGLLEALGDAPRTTAVVLGAGGTARRRVGAARGGDACLESGIAPPSGRRASEQKVLAPGARLPPPTCS